MNAGYSPSTWMRNRGTLTLDGAKPCDSFLKLCANLRFWERELNVDLDAKAFAKKNSAKPKG